MLTPTEALARVLRAAREPVAERVALGQAYGRVLAEDITCRRAIPPWDNSAMDGFAVRAADTPGTLRVLETIAAGELPTQTVLPGTCSRIMTGAPTPEGADAVVMVERTEGSDPVRILARVEPGENIRRRGDDVAEGQEVLAIGETLHPAAVGMVASMGMPSVLVAQRPRVAVLSTGDEVVEPGWPVDAGQIWSSNTQSLVGLILEAGGEPVHCGIAPDDPQGLRAALRRCMRADLVLTTGGVSMGDFDYVKDAFDDVGAQLDFWKVAMRPGKPLAFGTLSGLPAFGLPGNPVSCMVSFLQFVRPVIRTSLGDPRPYLPVLHARLTAPVGKRVGLVHYARVRLSWQDGELLATPTSTQSSGVLTTMVQADGLTLTEAQAGPVPAGTVVPVQVLRWSWASGEGPGYPG